MVMPLLLKFLGCSGFRMYPSSPGSWNGRVRICAPRLARQSQGEPPGAPRDILLRWESRSGSAPHK